MLRAARTPSHIIRPSLIFTLWLGLLSPTLVIAESRLAQQALHCSAIFSVFAESLADDSKRVKEFKRGVEIFTELYVKESEGDPAAAKRDAEQRRTALLSQFQQQCAARALPTRRWSRLWCLGRGVFCAG